jgi:hypothetical protein
MQFCQEIYTKLSKFAKTYVSKSKNEASQAGGASLSANILKLWKKLGVRR